MSMEATSQHGIRKAAILVSCLDRAGRDAVLDQMQDDQARLVRQAMVDLGPVEPAERQAVLDAFFRAGTARPGSTPSGLELDDRLARKLSGGSEDETRAPSERAAAPSAPPFGFLRETEEARLARLLNDERPQTIALVLSHLPQKQAGRTLIHFSPRMQAEVLRRLAHLEETDPEILREVERGLQARLAHEVPMERPRVAGLEAISGILKAADGEVGTRIADNLAEHDGQLAERFLPSKVDFDDFCRLESKALATVIESVAPDVAVLALFGAAPELVNRMLRQVAPSEAAGIWHRLENLGPVRLSDVEEARRRMAEAARRLVMAGRIEPPRRTNRLPVEMAA